MPDVTDMLKPKLKSKSKSQPLPQSLPRSTAAEWQRQRFSMVGAFIILPFHVQLAAKSKVTAPRRPEINVYIYHYIYREVFRKSPWYCRHILPAGVCVCVRVFVCVGWPYKISVTSGSRSQSPVET